MHWFSRIAAVSLLIAICGAFSAAYALEVPSSENNHPAGCHGEQPMVPSRGPVDFRCCVGGHHWASPAAPFSFVFPIREVGTLYEAPLPDFPVLQTSQSFLITSASPPGSSPLRI